MMEANPVSMPLSKTMELVIPIGSNNTPTIDVPYVKAIGLLMYAALRTRPDIAFTVQHLSQFTMSYSQEHWTAIKNALQYLKGMWDNGIIFRQEAGLHLEVFVDSDYTNRADA